MKNLRLDYVKNGELEKEITIAENFVTRAFEIYYNKEFKNLSKIEGLIKVMLNVENGLTQLTDGIEYNNEKYLPLVTSPGMQKKEDIEGKCEYLFVNEVHKQFIEDFERLISGNKIAKQLEKQENMCLVKDIVARIGLATSGAEQIKYNPKIVILPEATYNLTNKYTILEEMKDDEGNVVDGEFKTGELEREFTANDGGGLMSNHMAEIIKQQLKLDYRVDFAVIRYYKALAVKGLVLRFDFSRYIKENFKETDFCKYENGIYMIKDIFGEYQDIDKIDLLLNETQVKWLGNWDEKGSLKDLEQEYKDEFYDKYIEILDCLYVTKTNKNPSKLKTHTQVNYQVLQNTCLTDSDLIELAQPSINYYKKLLDFNKLENLDEIRLFLGDLAETKENETTYDDNITTKINFILKRMGVDALKMRWTQRQVARLIKKKTKELSGGKIWLEGGYKLGALDPISYCDWIIHRGDNFGTNGLEENEYYVARETGKRTLYRNPIALYQELQKVTLANKLDKWLGDYTPELLFFNAKDNRLFLMSTADLDGDGFGCIKNDLLYNCVVEEEYPFINKKDGNKVEHNFTREQLYQDILASSGNIIGNIAMSNCKLNAEMTSLNNFVVVNDNGKTPCTYSELRDFYIDAHKIKLDEMTEEERKAKNKEITKALKEKIKTNEQIYKVYDFDNDGRRKIVKILFSKNKYSYFYILLASQLAIDMPKTLTPIPAWLEEKLKKFKYLKKPVFMHYLEKCDCGGKGSVNDCKDILVIKYTDKKGKERTIKNTNMMDCLNTYIVRELLVDVIKKANCGENSNKLLKVLDYKVENGQVNKKLEQLYKKYSEKRIEYKSDDEKLNKLDLNVFNKMEELNLNDTDIVVSLKSLKANVRFIMMFCWDTVKNKIEEQNLIKNYSFIRNKDGEVSWLFEKYKKVEVTNTNIVDLAIETKKNLLNKNELLKRIRVGGYTGLVITDNFYVLNKKLYREVDNTELGFIFDYDKAGLEDDMQLEMIDYNVAKNGRSVTINCSIAS